MKQRTGLFMTALAVLFLLLDGVLLGWVGIAFSRPPFIALSVVFFLAAGTVVAYFRRHLRNLSEIREAQLMLQSEMNGMLQVARGKGAPSARLDSPSDQ